MFDSDEMLVLSDILGHEFKTPIMAIQSHANNIEKRYQEGILDTIDVSKSTSAIRYCCNTLLRLSTNLSVASKKNKLAADRFYYDVAEQIHTICFMTSELFGDGNIRIEFIPKTKQLMASADPNFIMSILLNLISNGIKYNKSDIKHIQITGEVKNDTLYLAVKDNGMGFDKEDAERIFERYYRSDSSRNITASGLGLGLFIVKKMVEAHDGTIIAGPTKKGTTFKIEIPPKKLPVDEVELRSPRRVFVSEQTIMRELAAELENSLY